MRTTVQAPNGEKITVEHPEGASEAEIISYAQKNYAPPKPVDLGPGGFAQAAKEVMSEQGPIGRFAQGAGETFDRAALGLKGLFTDLTPEDKLRLEQNKAMSAHGGIAGTVGGMAADAAITAPLFAATGGVAAPVVRAALPQTIATATRAAAPRLLPQIAAEGAGAAAGGAAAGAVMSPEDRWGGAKGGAIGGAAGYGAGRVLNRALGGGVPASEEAADLMRQGVRVPIHQAADQGTLVGGVVNRVGEAARRYPVAGHMIRSTEARGLQDWNRNLVRDATPPRPVTDDGGNILRWVHDPVTEVGDDTVNLLKNRFNEAYDAVYRNRRVPLDETYGHEVQQLVAATDSYLPHLAPRVQGTVARIRDTLARGTESTTTHVGFDETGQAVTHTAQGHAAVTADAVKSAIRETEEAITSAYRSGDGELAGVYQHLRDSLEGLRARSLPPEVSASLQDVNAAYARFKPLQEAHGMLGAQRAGMVTPRQVLSAMKSGDRSAGKAAFEAGNLPGQRSVRSADRVLSHTLPDVGPGTADALATMSWLGGNLGVIGGDLGATALLGTAPGQRFLGGTYPWQRLFRSGAARDAAGVAGQTIGVATDQQRRNQRHALPQTLKDKGR